MKEYKTFTFDEVVDDVRMSGEAWRRVYSVPKEEYVQAVLRGFAPLPCSRLSWQHCSE